MKGAKKILAGLAVFGLSGAVWASEAETSARVGSDYRGTSIGDGTARYEGDYGFARTQSRSGNITLARGVAVGMDEGGLSLSLSNGVATRRGVAVATNFNLSIGNDGRVSGSGGTVVSHGALQRSAEAGGSTSTRRDAPAVSYAAGRSDPGGYVRADTHAWSRPSVRLVRPLRIYRSR